MENVIRETQCAYELPVSTPEEQGIPSGGIIKFLEELEEKKIELHAFEIVRHGKLVASAVAAPYERDGFHRIFSSAKGVVATAVLVAIQEGYFDIHDKVVPLLPKELLPQDLDPRWEELTIYHLLTMQTGHKEDTLRSMWGGEDNWITTFFKIRPDYIPGTYFKYDMGAQYVMNELVKTCTGEDTGTYLDSRIFKPMGIAYTAKFNDRGQFFSSTIQLQQGGLTKLGLLYLQEGMWNNKQLLRKDLAILAGQVHCANHHINTNSGQAHPDNNAGYGLHMWRNSFGGYRFSGGQGQFSVILPEYDMVFSTFAANDDPSRILTIFEKHILRACSYLPAPIDERLQKQLMRKLSGWNLAPQAVSDRSSMARKVSGKIYRFQPNPESAKTIRFDFHEDGAVLYTEDSRGSKVHEIGYHGNWKSCSGYLLIDKENGDIADLDLIYGEDKTKMLSSGGWCSEHEFEFSLRSKAMLCDYHFLCCFVEDTVEVTISTRAHNHRKVHEAMGLQGTKKDEILIGKAEE